MATKKATTGKPETPVWKQGRTESTAMRVERQIKEALFDGHFTPGDFLGSENDLAAQFGVSRLPIREALGRLQTLGVVNIRSGAGGGARIAEGDPLRFSEALAIQLKLVDVSAEEIFDAQFAIEAAVAKLAARHATADDIEAMETALDRALSLINTQREFTQASMAFRIAVAKASQNRFLEAMIQAITHVMYRSLTPYTTETVAKGVIRRHRKLLDAIRAHDPQAAHDVVSKSLNALRKKYLIARDKAMKAPSP